MLCQICKEREATIHFTKIVNGEMEEKHICDNCGSGDEEVEINLPISFHKLFLDLMGVNQEESSELKCPKCGMSYKRLMEIGKFGCSKCYETFLEDMESLLQGIHGNTKHLGKVPMRKRESIMKKRQIDLLRNELDKAVREEDFERAAVLRDEIFQKSDLDLEEGK